MRNTRLLLYLFVFYFISFFDSRSTVESSNCTEQKQEGALPPTTLSIWLHLAPPPFLFNASRPSLSWSVAIVHVGEDDPSYPTRQNHRVHSSHVRNCIGSEGFVASKTLLQG
jgi:hypothetical protein